jgi:hypothetical protein
LKVLDLPETENNTNLIRGSKRREPAKVPKGSALENVGNKLQNEKGKKLYLVKCM